MFLLMSQQKGRGQDEGHRGGQGDPAPDPDREDSGHQETLLVQVCPLLSLPEMLFMNVILISVNPCLLSARSGRRRTGTAGLAKSRRRTAAARSAATSGASRPG